MNTNQLKNLIDKKKPKQKVDPNLTSVLHATGRTITEPDKLKSAAQIIAGNVALAQLLKVRDEL